jgi:cob(I)alamin adenosyltransferase
MKERGLIHVYTGDGKGKTTAGMGLSVRAAGAGLKVLIYQFMKDNGTSERKILESLPGVTFLDGLPMEKFSFQLTEEEKPEKRRFYEDQLKEAVRIAQEGGYDLLFLDEVLYTISAGLLSEQSLLSFLDQKPEGLEVVLTGRNPGPEVLERADYVSEIRKIKHPFDRGVGARPGIER